MGAVYATAEDIINLGRRLTVPEQEQAAELCKMASALLRSEAKKRGHDLDQMIVEDDDVGVIAKTITVSAVVRALNASTDTTPTAVQASQAAMGYSVSATFLNAGQNLYFLKNELKQLGLLRQRYGAMEVF